MPPSRGLLPPLVFLLIRYVAVRAVILNKAENEKPSAAVSFMKVGSQQTVPDVTCGTGLTSIYREWQSYKYRIVLTNGIPNFYHHKPYACMKAKLYVFNTDPVERQGFAPTPLGEVGVMKTGALLYNSLAGSGAAGAQSTGMLVRLMGSSWSASLDKCQGKTELYGVYHIHGLSRQNGCSRTGLYKDCELVGYLKDGHGLYSQCGGLKSCYEFDRNSTSGSYINFNKAGCQLDEANGYDFTGKGIRDSNGVPITGYQYILPDTSESPLFMPHFKGAVFGSNPWESAWVDQVLDTAAHFLVSNYAYWKNFF